MQSTRRRGLFASEMLAAAALASMAAAASAADPSHAPPRRAIEPQPPSEPTRAGRHRRDRAPGWHDPQRLAAADAKRARKAVHRLRCAERGAFGQHWRAVGA